MSDDVFDGDEEELRFSRTYDRKKVYAASKDTHGHGDAVYFKQPTYVHDLVVSIVNRDDSPWKTPAAFYRDATIHRLHDLTEVAGIDISEEVRMACAKIEIDQRIAKRKAAEDLIESINTYLTSSAPTTARSASSDMLELINEYISESDPDLIAQYMRLDSILRRYNY